MGNTFDFKKKRDFNELLIGTFGFFKLEWRNYLVGILPILLPLLVVSVLFNTAFFNDDLDNTTYNNIMSAFNITNISFFIISFTYSYVGMYNSEEGPKAELVRSYTFKLFLKYFPIFLITFAFQIISNFADEITYKGFLQFLINAGIGIIGLIFIIKLSLSFIIIQVEKKSITEAFSRSTKLMKLFWWKTFWSYFIICFITVIVIVFGAELIQTIIESSFPYLSHNLVFLRIVIIVNAIAMFIGVFLMQSILSVFCSLNYFSLVERKEAPSLIERVNRINNDDVQ